MIVEDKIKEAFLDGKRGNIYQLVMDETEKVLIEKALDYAYGNQLVAARFLGVNRNTIRNKIRRLNIRVEKFK